MGFDLYAWHCTFLTFSANILNGVCLLLAHKRGSAFDIRKPFAFVFLRAARAMAFVFLIDAFFVLCHSH